MEITLGNYIESSLRQACDAVRSSHGMRNNELNAEAFGLGQLVGAGVLDFETAKSGLLAAAEQCGLPRSEALSTISSGLHAGAKVPRDLGHVGASPKRKYSKLNGALRSRQAATNHQTKAEPSKTSKYARQIWLETKPAEGTIAEGYLNIRGYNGPIPPALKFHPSVYHAESGVKYPTMVGLIVDNQTQQPAIHVTYLKPDGSGKADVRPAKKVFGPFKGGHILLGRISTLMGVAEGIEKALVVGAETGVNMISALSASNMDNVVWPDQVDTVTIFGDRGKAGEDAVNKACAAFHSQGKTVYFAFSPEGCDWDEIPSATIQELCGEAKAYTPSDSDFDDQTETIALEFDSDLSLEDLQSVNENALVKRMISRGVLAVLYSKYGLGKTTIALNLGRAIASASEWAGRKVRNVPVLYVGLEGQGGLRKRILAAKEEKGDCGNMFARMTTHVSLSRRSGDGGARDIIAAAKMLSERAGEHVGFIIIDTVARAMAGDQENDAADMTHLVELRIGHIQRETGAAVLLVHHAGWDGSHMRGSSALGAAADVVMRIECDVDKPDYKAPRRLVLEKCKDDEDGITLFEFTLRPINLGEDEDGDPITSCVVEPVEGTIRRRISLSPQQSQALQFLYDALIKFGETSIQGPNDIPGQTRFVRIDHWREECRKRRLSTSDKPDSQSKAFNRASEELRNKDVIAFFEEFVWIVRDELVPGQAGQRQTCPACPGEAEDRTNGHAL